MALDALSRRALEAGLRQPDGTTCGSCVLVVSRMLHDPSYAAFLVDGVCSTSLDAADQTIQDRFRHESLVMHRVTSTVRDSAGRWQPPWPSSLGTPPWAVAREMTISTGDRHAALPVLPARRARTFDRLLSLTKSGRPVALYVGNRWSPRHVLLVLPGDAGDAVDSDVLVHDPADGRCHPISRLDFVTGSIHVSRWHVPWAVVVPTTACGCGW